MSNKINIIFLPFAGGSCYSYRSFEKYLSDFAHPVAIDLPGHGRRLREPLLTDIHQMVEDAFLQVRRLVHKPYAIYGHSLGGLLGYLLAKQLVFSGAEAPMHLFVSGRGGPSVVSRERDIYLLPRDKFFEKVKEYGGTPDEVLREEDLMRFFEPILRADFEALETYEYEEDGLLHVPVTAMIGSEERTTYADALRWREVSSGEVSIKQFPGRHFFIFDHLPEVCAVVRDCLQPVARH